MRPPVVKRPVRADAARNRHHLLVVAQELFAAEGLGVSVDDIARRAEVGIGTLYRHFPTKDALIAAIVVDRIEQMTVHAEALASARDPGAALFELIERLVVEGAAKKYFVDALGGPDKVVLPGAESTKRRFRAALAALLTRAHIASAIRADVTAADLVALVHGVFAAAGDDARARARYLAILLDGLRVR